MTPPHPSDASGTFEPRATVRAVLLRELGAVRRSVAAYPDDDAPWVHPPGLPNAGGTLVLHLCGNLRHYVGAVLGGSGYVRDRDAEFARRGVPRAELAAEVDRAAADVAAALDALPDVRLAAPYPQPGAHHSATTGEWLLHLATHLAYHLGQLDYHRRVVTGDARSVGAVALAELRGAGGSA